MSKKAIFVTFISTALVVVLVGLLSWWMWVNQPTADVGSPPVPAEPQRGASIAKPPVPPEPRIMGDVIDDGIVNVLDVNGVITQWKQKNSDYNLVDEAGADQNVIDSLEMVQIFKYWKCQEALSGKNCPYR